MLAIRLLTYQVEFILRSFERPDPYSKAASSGVRITNITRFLFSLSFQIQIIFIGSPGLPGLEGYLNFRRRGCVY